MLKCSSQFNPNKLLLHNTIIHNGNYGEPSDAEGHIGQGFTIKKGGESRVFNTISSTARTMQRVKDGKLPPEDLEVCLTANAKSIGYSVDNLRKSAIFEVERLERENEKAQKETNSIPTDFNLESNSETFTETTEPQM